MHIFQIIEVYLSFSSLFKEMFKKEEIEHDACVLPVVSHEVK